MRLDEEDVGPVERPDARGHKGGLARPLRRIASISQAPYAATAMSPATKNQTSQESLLSG